MKRPTLKIWIKLLLKNEIVYSSHFSKKAVLSSRLRTLKWTKAYIKVTYGNGHYNDGWYSKLEDIKWALSTFTEKDLVDYLSAIK